MCIANWQISAYPTTKITYKQFTIISSTKIKTNKQTSHCHLANYNMFSNKKKM